MLLRYVNASLCSYLVIQTVYCAVVCSMPVMWHITWKRKDKHSICLLLLNNSSIHLHLYLSTCVISSIANDLCWFHRGRHHGHLSWHWEPQWEALYPYFCGPFAETGLPLCCAQSPRGLAEHWAHLPSHVHLRYETFMDYDHMRSVCKAGRGLPSPGHGLETNMEIFSLNYHCQMLLLIALRGKNCP